MLCIVKQCLIQDEQNTIERDHDFLIRSNLGFRQPKKNPLLLFFSCEHRGLKCNRDGRLLHKYALRTVRKLVVTKNALGR